MQLCGADAIQYGIESMRSFIMIHTQNTRNTILQNAWSTSNTRIYKLACINVDIRTKAPIVHPLYTPPVQSYILSFCMTCYIITLYSYAKYCSTPALPEPNTVFALF